MELDTKEPIMSHVAELRNRLLWSVLVLILTTGFSLVFTRYIFEFLEARAGGIDLIYIEMTEMLGAYFRVAFISGFSLALPFFVYQFIMFVRPGLKENERRYLYLLLPGILFSFAAGAAFGYFILIPPMVRFLITFGSDIATPQIRVGNFVSLMLRLIFAIGLSFEMPIVIFFLSRLGIVTPERLSRFRKFAFVLAFVLGAAITPTFDPVNQTIVALPLVVLYEIGILLSRIARRRQKKTA